MTKEILFDFWSKPMYQYTFFDRVIAILEIGIVSYITIILSLTIMELKDKIKRRRK